MQVESIIYWRKINPLREDDTEISREREEQVEKKRGIGRENEREIQRRTEKVEEGEKGERDSEGKG